MKRPSLLTAFPVLLLSFALLAAPGASAQVASTSIPGISVTGFGRASAPAETATIVIMLGSGDSYKDPSMMETTPTPPGSPQEMAQPVIDALANAGVPAAAVEVLTDASSYYTTPYGTPMMVTLRFTIDSPSSQGIGDLLGVATTAASDAGLYVNMTSALYGVADCASLVRGARENAIGHAREQATLQAELLDVGLGDIVASRDDLAGAMYYGGMYVSGQVNSCTMDVTDGSMASVYNAPAFDPSAEPMVTMTSAIELTFEIVPAGAATPGS